MKKEDIKEIKERLNSIELKLDQLVMVKTTLSFFKIGFTTIFSLIGLLFWKVFGIGFK